MGKKIFISHSSQDKNIVSLFVENILVAGCGIRQEDIMYTSCEDMGVSNGEDIPSAIKQGIQCCKVFLMMVSENYRASEICMNEMGAAWITDSIEKKCILLLPDVSFDKMGWLMSLSKANKLDEEEGLNHFHDVIIPLLGLPLMTGTWNKYRSAFLSNIQCMVAHSSVLPTIPVTDMEAEDENDEDLDLLAIRERFESHTSAYIESVSILTNSLNSYSEQIVTYTQKLNRYNENPQSFNASQLRGIFSVLAKETDKIADIQNAQNPILKRHFDESIKYAILLRGIDLNAETKIENEEEVNKLIRSIKHAYSQMSMFMDSLDDMPDLDRSFTKSKNRLKKSLEELLSTLSFCVGRSNEYLI